MKSNIIKPNILLLAGTLELEPNKLLQLKTAIKKVQI